MKKLWGLIKAFGHWFTCRGETWIHSEGKLDTWTQVTRIYCDHCNKTFYEKKQ